DQAHPPMDSQNAIFHPDTSRLHKNARMDGPPEMSTPTSSPPLAPEFSIAKATPFLYISKRSTG
ncbi:MAG: hypothetical protein KDL10_00460, partial [Kiritimatiellae bacterium]|nr:hypothetical protein [Kiritimatiellia bacterium]